MTPVLKEFEDGLAQFVGLPDNTETRTKVLMYVNDFMQEHGEDGDFLFAYIMNGFQNPYEGML
jgi:hypothetical protein